MLNKSPQTNPYVVAIVPEPVDYFRACGLTSVCRSRCRAEIQAFEDANANPTRISQTFTVSDSPKRFARARHLPFNYGRGNVNPMLNNADVHGE